MRPPKARGGFGELLLANLLRDRLPAGAYELQYGFRGGERVDAVIRVDRLVPVDAKFPLDNFERLAEAEDDEHRALAEKAFARDLKIHVDAIAQKYIPEITKLWFGGGASFGVKGIWPFTDDIGGDLQEWYVGAFSGGRW